MTRNTNFSRKTGETQIQGCLNLDGSQNRNIDTGVAFLDHMLDLLAFHGRFDLEIKCIGDLDVCPHHTIEDTAITLGQAFVKAIGDRKGIIRYGSCYLPMDETLTRTVLDISGRPFHVYKGELSSPSVGNFPTEMVSHFFYSFAINASITLHQEILYGSNDHHKIESLFKGLAVALNIAVQKRQLIIDNKISQTRIDENVPSTKKIL